MSTPTRATNRDVSPGTNAQRTLRARWVFNHVRATTVLGAFSEPFSERFRSRLRSIFGVGLHPSPAGIQSCYACSAHICCSFLYYLILSCACYSARVITPHILQLTRVCKVDRTCGLVFYGDFISLYCARSPTLPEARMFLCYAI